MPNVDESLIARLMQMTSLPRERCREALEANDGELNLAIMSLVKAGDVAEKDANLDLGPIDTPALKQLMQDVGVPGLDLGAAQQMAKKLLSQVDAGRDISPRAGFSSDSVRQLWKISGAKPQQCEAAMRENAGDLQKSLRALIVSGTVGFQKLDPDLCTDEHYALVQIVIALKAQERFGAIGRIIGGTKVDMETLPQQLAGTIPIADNILRAGAKLRRRQLEDKHPELLKDKPTTWTHPVLGTLKYERDELEGVVVVPAFKAFVYNPDYSPKEPPTGKLRVLFRLEDDWGEPARGEAALVLQVIDNAETLVSKICRALWADFTGHGPNSGIWWHNNLDQVNKYLDNPASDEEDLLRLMRPHDLTPRHVRGRLLVEIVFSAAFEEEHGVGVLTDGHEVLGFGYAGSADPFKPSSGTTSEKPGNH